MNDPVAVYDGKYTFFLGDDGLLDCHRHGETWPAFRGTGAHLSGSTLALYQDLLMARETKGCTSSYQAWAEAFSIFAKYSGEGEEHDDVDAQHDEVFAGPSPEKVEGKDRVRLEELNWIPCEEHDCWKRFT